MVVILKYLGLGNTIARFVSKVCIVIGIGDGFGRLQAPGRVGLGLAREAYKDIL